MESQDTKKNNFKRIIIDCLITIICVGCMIGVFAYVKNRNKSNSFDEENVNGSIIFKLYDDKEVLVIDDELKFTEGENIYNILDRNYTLETMDSFGIGKAIISVNEYKTSWTDDYFHC